MAKIHRNPNGVNPLKLGVKEDGTEVLITDQSLLNNGLIVIGSKNTGKSSLVPDIFQQEIVAPYVEDDGKTYYPVTNACVVVITSRRNQSYELYSLGRKWKRPAIRFLKPSANFSVKNELLGMENYNYDKVNEIIDFVHALQEKEAVIIDMEVERYGEAAIQAVGMLLMQLQIAIHNTAETNKRRCYLIIDDAFMYLPYLEVLLRYGAEYNLSTIMMFDSSQQYVKYKTLVETNIQNYLLMSNLYYEDADYFSKRFLLNSPKELIGNGKSNCFSVVYDDDMKMQSGPFRLQGVLDDHNRELMAQSSVKYKKTLDKQGGDEEYMAFIMKSYAEYVINTNRRFKTGSWANATSEAVKKRAERIENASPDDKKAELIQRTTGPVLPPQKVPQASPEQPPDDDTTTFTTHMKRQPASVGVPKLPKKKPTQNKSTPGMQELLGAVNSAPPRLKEKLAEKGITEETIRHVPTKKPQPHNKPNNPSQKHTHAQQQSGKSGNNNPTNVNKPQFNTETARERLSQDKQAEQYNQKSKDKGQKKSEKNKQQKQNFQRDKKKPEQQRFNLDELTHTDNLKENVSLQSDKEDKKNETVKQSSTQTQAKNDVVINDVLPNDDNIKQDNPINDIDTIPEWIDDLDMSDAVSQKTVLSLDKNLAQISELPKSADEVFSDNTQKFLEMMQDEGSRPSFFSHRKEIQEMEKRFNKRK